MKWLHIVSYTLVLVGALNWGLVGLLNFNLVTWLAELVIKDGKKYKQYNGSASLTEKKKHVKIDSTDKNANYVQQIEGVESLVTYKGPVNNVINNLLAGVRSGLSYSGARSIPELWKKHEFIQITSGGLRENGAHDVIVV